MKRTIPIFALVITGCATSQTTKTLIAPNGEVRVHDAQLNTLLAAEKVMDGLEERRRNGEPITPLFLEMEYNWSKRLAESEHDAAPSDVQRATAMQQHLERMQASQRELKGMQLDPTTGVIQLAQAEFYVAEAQRMVADLGKK